MLTLICSDENAYSVKSDYCDLLSPLYLAETVVFNLITANYFNLYCLMNFKAFKVSVYHVVIAMN